MTIFLIGLLVIGVGLLATAVVLLYHISATEHRRLHLLEEARRVVRELRGHAL
jgi:hypothetical protein